MRRYAPFVLIVVLMCSGCVSQQAKRVSRETAQLTEKYAELSKTGKTTPEQDKAYIQAVAKDVYELDRAMRGTKQADVTKQAATVEAQTGVSLDQPLKLDK
jgi:hypothetical protein